jgi:error-prone DNA polymerase
LPLFAAASAKNAEIISELDEPDVTLKPMTSGSEVVEDYAHVGLTLRAHPVSFLRPDLRHRRIVTCAEAMEARDGKWLEAAGLVLVRQRPGSAKGVMFITIEDESGVANLVVWVKTFEKYRRVVLAAGMVGVYGKVQREGSVVHLVAHRLTDLSAELASVGDRGGAFPMPHGRGDEFRHGRPALDPRGINKPRDIWDPTEHIDKIKVRTRDFK